MLAGDDMKMYFGFVKLPLPCYEDVDWLMTKAKGRLGAPSSNTRRQSANRYLNGMQIEWIKSSNNVLVNSSNLNS